MNIYRVYVLDAKEWDRECTDSRGVFFGEIPNYMHPARGGMKPSGHIVVRGYKAAVMLRDQLNKEGDWSGGERPVYAIEKAGRAANT